MLGRRRTRNRTHNPILPTILALVLAECGNPATPVVDLAWLGLGHGDYTGSFQISFSDPAEQSADSGAIRISILQSSASKFTGTVSTTATTSGPLAGNFTGRTITVTQFGDVGAVGVLRSVAERCDAGSAVVSTLPGSISYSTPGFTTRLILSGTVTTVCHYPSGTYSTVAPLKIDVSRTICASAPLQMPPQNDSAGLAANRLEC